MIHKQDKNFMSDQHYREHETDENDIEIMESDAPHDDT